MTSIRTNLLVPALLGAALLLGTGTAQAASLVREGNALVLRAAPGEVNHLSLADDEFSASRVQFVDRGGYGIDVAAALGCEGFDTEWGGSFLNCPYAGVTAIRLEAGDGNDELDISPHDLPPGLSFELDGGLGDDDLEGPTTTLPVRLLGGDGADRLNGGLGADLLDGGPGNDNLDGDDGADQVLGGLGDDVVAGGRRLATDLVDGGPGVDSILGDWSDPNAPPQPIEVSLDGAANDGRAGEADNVVAVERIKVALVSRLVAGADPVDFEVEHSPFGDSTLVGGPAADRLAGDTGNDTIVGGGGPDTIFGDLGDDTIDARDGVSDSVDCGYGLRDVAQVDAIDVVTNCEAVGGAAAGAGGKEGSACKVPRIARAAKPAAAKQALRRAGCDVRVKRVSSKVRRGRVARLSSKAGTQTGKPVVVYVSQGPRKSSGVRARPASSAPLGVLARAQRQRAGKEVAPRKLADLLAPGKGWGVEEVLVVGETTAVWQNGDGSHHFDMKGNSRYRSSQGHRVRPLRLIGGSSIALATLKPADVENSSVAHYTSPLGTLDCSLEAKGPDLPDEIILALVAKPSGAAEFQLSLAGAGWSCPSEGEIDDLVSAPSDAAAGTVKRPLSINALRRNWNSSHIAFAIKQEQTFTEDGMTLHQEWKGVIELARHPKTQIEVTR